MNNMLNEAPNRGMDKIDFLIRNGLGSDLSRMSYYRQIIQNPQQAIRNVVFQKYAAEVLNNLLNYVFKDPVLYNRLRQLLVSSGKHMANMKPSAFESLLVKATSKGVALEDLIEEYEEGYEDDSRPEWLSREQYAFNRVNNFLAGNDSEEPTNIKEESKTIKTIRRITRKKNCGK